MGAGLPKVHSFHGKYIDDEPTLHAVSILFRR